MPKKISFPQAPICELDPSKLATHFTRRRGKWLFVSTDSPEDPNEYHFPITDFFKSPAATVDWLAHLSEKSWFDSEDFLAMIHRFREATKSFGSL